MRKIQSGLLTTMISHHLSYLLKSSRVPSLLALSSTLLLGGEEPPQIEEPPVSEPPEFAFTDLFTPTADLRLRYEFGDQDPLDESHAATLHRSHRTGKYCCSRQ